ncbi:MAG: ribonuclease R [Clostridia bacterium]|nr:ribonuclease R [Clostridia bacterium]
MIKVDLFKGKIIGNERGFAFLEVEGAKNDFFISHKDLNGALHGDVVLAKNLFRKGHSESAEVVKILERGVKELVGTFHTSKSGGFVVPDDNRFSNDVFIPHKKINVAKTGDKVVCKITSYPKKQNPEGEIKEVLGKQFEKETEIKCIAKSFNLPLAFPKKVVDYAKQISKEIDEIEIKNREDFRNKVIITIDGEDAKDFDDAISVEKLENGNYLLGVHIADVTHYVKENDPIDKEAYSRGTSVYFPEMVIPMLPNVLCNDLCSLRPNQDRLTLSCMMEVDKEGEVVDRRIVKSVIRSKRRMTYERVQLILDGDKDLCVQYEEILPLIKDMETLAKILVNKRDKKGSINLDVKESKITVNKKEIFIEEYKRNFSNQIIEEFMICANETVAEYMFYLEKPFIYRIHEKPDEEKLNKFLEFLNGLGIVVKFKKNKVFPSDFNALLKKLEGNDKFFLVNRVMLRSMQKAKYSPEDVGHFGLSSEHYCHFTSPIRRYPDLVIHRIIKAFLDGEGDLEERFGEFVYTASNESSKKERNAIEAERAVDDYYKIQYMSGKIGEEFEGIISGVTNFGIFVELKNTVEGLVRLNVLKGGRYLFDEKTYTLSNKKNKYKLGDKVKIKVAGVDYGNKRAEFLLVD